MVLLDPVGKEALQVLVALLQDFVVKNWQAKSFDPGAVLYIVILNEPIKHTQLVFQRFDHIVHTDCPLIFILLEEIGNDFIEPSLIYLR